MITEAVAESNGTLRPVRVEISAEVCRAFLDLYKGLLEANESGLGYSPKTADAMKRLKGLVSPELLETL